MLHCIYIVPFVFIVFGRDQEICWASSVLSRCYLHVFVATRSLRLSTLCRSYPTPIRWASWTCQCTTQWITNLLKGEPAMGFPLLSERQVPQSVLRSSRQSKTIWERSAFIRLRLYVVVLLTSAALCTSFIALSMTHQMDFHRCCYMWSRRRSDHLLLRPWYDGGWSRGGGR